MATEAATGQTVSRPGIVSLGSVVRVAETIVGAVLLILILQWVLEFEIADPRLWSIYWRPFTDGIVGSLGYIALILPVSVLMGFFLGWARISRFRVLAWPVATYVDFFRGVPPLVIVIFASLIGPSLMPERFQSRTLGLTLAALALAFHSAAYQAEIFRAGFQSVHRGQLEAAQALGLKPLQAMRHVVLPQAFRLSLPPLGNELAVLIKDTSLLSAIGAIDIFGLSQDVQQQLIFTPGSDLRWLFIIWTAVALVYFVMTYAMTTILAYLERRVRVRGLETMSI